MSERALIDYANSTRLRADNAAVRTHMQKLLDEAFATTTSGAAHLDTTHAQIAARALSMASLGWWQTAISPNGAFQANRH
ncbi:MAG TPA: hypothetical protein VIN35_04520, partial [Hydrogenophaga sp.]